MPSKSLTFYGKKLIRERHAFACPHCQTEGMLARYFESHCAENHDLNPKLECVWCEGRNSWPSKEKGKNVPHLVSCFKQFMRSVKNPPGRPITRPQPTAMDTTPMHPKHDSFDVAFDPPPGAFDLPWPLRIRSNRFAMFREGGLGRAVACVRRYFGDLSPAAYDWFHALVRTPAYRSFLEAMEADGGRSQTLPFSCWCNGGRPPEPRLRQHRHLLVVSPRGHFVRNVWSHVRPEDPSRRHFKYTHLERIKDAMHLVNTMGYLSSRRSRCTFAGEKGDERDHHFQLSEELPPLYRLPCVLQWKGGLLQLLKQEFKNIGLEELVTGRLVFSDGKWHFRIKDIPGIRLDVVLPVAKEFLPCRRPTSHFIHLVGDGKLYFERNPKLLGMDRDAWLRTQAEAGNQLYAAVGEELWSPRPHYQAIIHAFKPFVDRTRELEVRNAQLAETQQVCLEENRGLKRKCDVLSDELKCSETEVKRLMIKINDLNEGEIARQRKDITRLEKEVTRLEKEVTRLEKENAELH